MGKDVRPVFVEEHRSDIKHSVADIGLAKRLLGYAPEWTFEQGMKETIKWYDEMKY
jgi:nucleoside-diphosphate-sugar epimerase